MNIKVVADDSIEGLEIKKVLEDSEFSNKLNNSFQIRWGKWVGEKDNVITLNSCQAIKNTLDKEILILTLRKNHINCPKRIKPGKKSDFPILGRNYEHNGGTDIKVIDSLEEYKKCNSEYFIEYIEFVEEYRVHVMDTEVFFIEEKCIHKQSHVLRYLSRNTKINARSFIAREELERNINGIYNTQVKNRTYENLNEPVIRTYELGWRFRKSNLDHLSIRNKETLNLLAKKAVYALGLDFGTVNIGRTVDNKFYVLDVEAVCRHMAKDCEEAYVQEFMKVLLKYDKLMSGSIDVTIGADPECLLKDKDTNALVYASDFFTKEGSCGFDDRSIEAGKRYFPLVEIRPQSSTNPKEVVESIYSILKKLGENVPYKNIGIFAGSMPVQDYWTGGHIHFGIKPNNKLIRMLDNYLALPVMMIENSCSSRKRKIKYGALGNFRLKSHGGFEYCTLSSWLVSPEITKSILCLAKVVVQEHLNLKEEFLCSYSDIRAFYLVNKIYFKDKLERIIFNISETKTYKEYEYELEPLFKKIMNCEEWNESVDIKEAWGISYRNDIYKPTLRCFIPKKKREELNINLDDVILVMIGRSLYELKVYPKDDFSADKEGFVSFSEDICSKIGIKEDDCLDIWFDSNDKVYKAGPILGIFCYTVDHPFGPFGFQSYYFRKIIKFSKDKGMIAYVFTIWDTEWKEHRINGYTYDFQKEEWVKRIFRTPDVIYDRGDVMNEKNYGQYAVDYIKYIKNNNIKFINSLDCINLTNDKLKTHQLLKCNDHTSKYLIETFEYEDNYQLIDCIEKYRHIYLKPKGGSRSKGIFFVERLDNNVYEVNYRKTNAEDAKLRVDMNNLFDILEQEISNMEFVKSDYIIQEAISLSRINNRSFEIRVVMQKNSKNMWIRTCMIARTAGENEKFINISTESDIKSSQIVTESFGENEREELRKASKAVTELLDSNNIQAGEIAIDFGIDENKKLYIIELNSKPDNLLAAIKAYKMRNLAIYRLLEYAKFLASK